MEINEILVVGMFCTFIAFLFTGIPVGYVLAGVGVLFGFLGFLSDMYLGTITGLDSVSYTHLTLPTTPYV